MKLFKCEHCNELLYFENNTCENCGYPLGFLTSDLELHPLVIQSDKTFTLYNGDSTIYKYCENHSYNVCNWLVPISLNQAYCEACQLNNTIPNLSKALYTRLWGAIENAKHRLVYSLMKMKLPIISKNTNYKTGLAFNFLAEQYSAKKVFTGHDDGLITLNIDEADDIRREMARKQMDEPYRTLLGHFRHEIGHYYWDRLIDNTPYLEEFRKLFGDERYNYDAALKKHYADGPILYWNLSYISKYASAHPWEDWAETWAHYMHIIDTLETAHAFGLNIAPSGGGVATSIQISPYQHRDFNQLINLWLPLTFAMNSLNRSMGLGDLYPFVIPQKAMEKLSFINKVCYDAATRK